MDRSLAAYRGHESAARTALPAPAAARLDSLVAGIEADRQTDDRQGVALGAIEAYRVLVEGLDESALAVPRAVSLLDYSGFRTVALASAGGTPDWPALAQTAAEARGFWTSVEGRIDDTALTDAMNTAVGGMEDAATREDAPSARFAGQVVLDLVDLLERHFEAARR